MSSIAPPLTSSVAISGLQRLLGAMDAAQFLESFLGEQMLQAPGAADRWSDLFSWREVNTALNSGFITVPRVRLVAKGTEVDPKLYSETKGERQYPDYRRVQRLMADGATLILQSIEGINPRLNTFVRELERDLNADVRVDAVATCASVPGLNMHWDNAECFNLQLDGQKHWQVICPERPYPLTATSRFQTRSDLIKPTAPDTPPTWEGTVKPGDLLYLPRGWWHAVTPQVSPSLHLSIAVDIPTLHDFLSWFAREAVAQTSVRRSIPVWRSAMGRQDGLDDALAAVKEQLSAASVETFLAQLSAPVLARPDYALPDAAAPGAPRLDAQAFVRLRSSRPLAWTVTDDTVGFERDGQPYRFHATVLPVLQKLDTMRAFTLDELSEKGNRLVVRACVVALLAAGVINVTEQRGGAPIDALPSHKESNTT